MTGDFFLALLTLDISDSLADVSLCQSCSSAFSGMVCVNVRVFS